MGTTIRKYAVKQGAITPENLEPDPKNPIVSAFFRTIGFAEELGSGVRKMFKYGKSFAGSDPTLVEGDVFRSTFDFEAELFKDVRSLNVPTNVPTNAPINVPINVPVNETVKGKVLYLISRNPGMNREHIARELQVDVKTIGRAIAALSGVVEHRGSKKTGGYYRIVVHG